MKKRPRACPFCGSAKNISVDVFDLGWEIWCSDNSCLSHLDAYYGSKEEAIDAWNKRPLEDDLEGYIAGLEKIISLFP